MFYNTWTYTYSPASGEHLFELNESCKIDREERDTNLCSGGNIHAWVHFPRIDNATNLQYKELLKQYVKEGLEKDLSFISKQLEGINNDQ